MIAQRLDALGRLLERSLDDVYERATRRAVLPALFGAALALMVTLAGLGAFVLILFVLVTFFA